ncbi:MAG: nitrate/sulfonate/bicarbonate ABC transporter ATP-binding protein [Rickettsiales bacterium]|nr:nitrate/sulfonate/bicarbonate ABC transporter ATP-binding protein [Rickettsiales bacterium]MCA0254684.1 nitrate/sulfonate/bicarbonate ABC transporter ATP-binding protein [Pseudomonadota bacterium]
MSDVLININSICKDFIKPDGHKQEILDNINIDIKSGEILAILGRSGCGKSTLLRIISGLITPSRGKIRFNNQPEKSFNISMIFQSFALFPWLSVLENVELGLEAMSTLEEEKRKRALQAIDLIGLDGFESAMPRELSGGMKQRVGFARALVVDPDILLMDEPFSALDILTSDTLKSDFLDLWTEKKIPLKSVIIVTHSIEEAVTMADRVILLGSNPGRVVSEIKINLPRPRNQQDRKFKEIVDKIYSDMAASVSQTFTVLHGRKVKEHSITHNLINVSPNQLAAVTATLTTAPYEGAADLAEIAKIMHLKTNDILRISEALQTLKFATITEGRIKLSKDGKLFGDGDVEKRKKIIAKHLIANVPLITYIIQILNERPDKKAPKLRFLAHLEDHMLPKEASSALKSIILLGRYAEIFSYDDNKQVFGLENPK